jgi:Cu2+-exporting ATPase
MFILSGDEPQKVRELAGRLGIAEGSAIGGLSPSGKADWIRLYTPCDALMLGDGANDSLAFDAALCRGTPVIHRDVLKGKADFYYLRRGIGGVTALLGIARRHGRVENAIIVFSVVYNLCAAGFAAAGLVNPLVAAVLMPASSAISLAIAGFGMTGRGADLMIECPSSPGDTIAIPLPKTA